jgi:tetratricopeptide (TPR) repeat protein
MHSRGQFTDMDECREAKLSDSTRFVQHSCYVVLYIGALVAVLLYQHRFAYQLASFDKFASTAEISSITQFQLFYERALNYRNINNYEAAVDEFYQAYQLIEEQPALLFAFPKFLEDFHRSLLNRSMIYLHQDNEAAAIQDYEFAMELFPELYPSNDRCWLMRRSLCDEQPPHAFYTNS